MRHALATVATACATLLASIPAQADEPPPAAEATPKPKPKRPLYSVPWGLRPAIPPNLVRSDTAFAYQGAATTVASTYTAGVKVADDAGVYLRGALVQHTPHGAAAAGNDRLVASNPLVFGIWSPKLSPTLRLPLFLGVALPIGTGGGDDGSRAAYGANAAGINARSGMDNALFAVNYLTPATGAGIAYVANGLTLQAEATILFLTRTRGEKFDLEPGRTNTTFGAHAGYLVVDWLTLSVELRHQRFLSTPVAVSKDEARRDQTTALVGVRFNVPVGSVLARPGIAYAHPIDDPMSALDYRVVQLDIPVLF